MTIFDPEIDRLLYTDETGDVVGLDEAQLLDEPPPKRIRQLVPLLRSDDPYLVYQVTRLLAAWAVPEGLAALEAAIRDRPPPGPALDPHRIDGSEEMRDRLAEAARVALLNGADPDAIAAIYRRMLALFGPVRFPSRLKSALLGWRGAPLTAEAVAAIERAASDGEVYMASQLLPVVARWDAHAFWDALHRFERVAPGTPDYRANIAEALGHIDGERATEALRALGRCEVAVVRDQARAALAGRGG